MPTIIKSITPSILGSIRHGVGVDLPPPSKALVTETNDAIYDENGNFIYTE